MYYIVLFPLNLFMHCAYHRSSWEFQFAGLASVKIVWRLSTVTRAQTLTDRTIMQLQIRSLRASDPYQLYPRIYFYVAVLFVAIKTVPVGSTHLYRELHTVVGVLDGGEVLPVVMLLYCTHVSL